MLKPIIVTAKMDKDKISCLKTYFAASNLTCRKNIQFSKYETDHTVECKTLIKQVK